MITRKGVIHSYSHEAYTADKGLDHHPVVHGVRGLNERLENSLWSSQDLVRRMGTRISLVLVRDSWLSLRGRMLIPRREENLSRDEIRYYLLLRKSIGGQQLRVCRVALQIGLELDPNIVVEGQGRYTRSETHIVIPWELISISVPPW